MTNTAATVARTYSSGTPFFTVECHACLVMLNSGHHYSADGLHHAEALAAEHNASAHGAAS